MAIFRIEIDGDTQKGITGFMHTDDKDRDNPEIVDVRNKLQKFIGEIGEDKAADVQDDKPLAALLSIQDKEKLKNSMLDFILRVIDRDCSKKSREEVVILPEIIKIALALY